MILVARILLALTLFALLAWILVGWFQTFLDGRYWEQAPIHLTILFGLVWPIFWIGTLGPLLLKTLTIKIGDDNENS